MNIDIYCLTKSSECGRNHVIGYWRGQPSTLMIIEVVKTVNDTVLTKKQAAELLELCFLPLWDEILDLCVLDIMDGADA